MISKEERDKTVEFLMVKPVSRSSIITSKIMASLTTPVTLLSAVTATGASKAVQADAGIAKLKEKVDTLIVVPNDRLLSVVDARDTVMGLTLANAATSASVTRPVARERVFGDFIGVRVFAKVMCFCFIYDSAIRGRAR